MGHMDFWIITILITLVRRPVSGSSKGSCIVFDLKRNMFNERILFRYTTISTKKATVSFYGSVWKTKN